MISRYDTYTSPLAERNASAEMLRLWSPRHKFNTWRRVWLAVAEAQHELGLPVSGEQVAELRAVVGRPGGITDEEIAAAERYERDLRHDVMAHVHALGDACPRVRGIIHSTAPPAMNAGGGCSRRRTPRRAGRGSRRCHLRGCCTSIVASVRGSLPVERSVA